MKKTIETAAILLMTLLTFTGCGAIGDKTGSMSVIYGVTAVFSLVLLIGYCCLIRKKRHLVHAFVSIGIYCKRRIF